MIKWSRRFNTGVHINSSNFELKLYFFFFGQAFGLCRHSFAVLVKNLHSFTHHHYHWLCKSFDFVGKLQTKQFMCIHAWVAGRIGTPNRKIFWLDLGIVRLGGESKPLPVWFAPLFSCPPTALCVTMSLTDSLTHSLTHSLTVIVEKHYNRALWDTCEPCDMLSEWWGDII